MASTVLVEIASFREVQMIYSCIQLKTANLKNGKWFPKVHSQISNVITFRVLVSLKIDILKFCQSSPKVWKEMWKADNSFRINGDIMYFTLDYFDQMDVL